MDGFTVFPGGRPSVSVDPEHRLKSSMPNPGVVVRLADYAKRQPKQAAAFIRRKVSNKRKKYSKAAELRKHVRSEVRKAAVKGAKDAIKRSLPRHYETARRADADAATIRHSQAAAAHAHIDRVVHVDPSFAPLPILNAVGQHRLDIQLLNAENAHKAATAEVGGLKAQHKAEKKDFENRTASMRRNIKLRNARAHIVSVLQEEKDGVSTAFENQKAAFIKAEQSYNQIKNAYPLRQFWRWPTRLRSRRSYKIAKATFKIDETIYKDEMKRLKKEMSRGFLGLRVLGAIGIGGHRLRQSTLAHSDTMRAKLNTELTAHEAVINPLEKQISEKTDDAADALKTEKQSVATQRKISKKNNRINRTHARHVFYNAVGNAVVGRTYEGMARAVEKSSALRSGVHAVSATLADAMNEACKKGYKAYTDTRKYHADAARRDSTRTGRVGVARRPATSVPPLRPARPAT